MGYTHYWNPTRGFSDSEWVQLRDFVPSLFQVAGESGVALGNGIGRTGSEPVVDDEVIAFNGIGENGYETFMLKKDGTGFAFCKTARKPYDAVVVAVLVRASEISDGFMWSSDGDNEPGHLDAAQALINKIGGRKRLYVKHYGDWIEAPLDAGFDEESVYGTIEVCNTSAVIRYHDTWPGDDEAAVWWREADCQADVDLYGIFLLLVEDFGNPDCIWDKED